MIEAGSHTTDPAFKAALNHAPRRCQEALSTAFSSIAPHIIVVWRIAPLLHSITRSDRHPCDAAHKRQEWKLPRCSFQALEKGREIKNTRIDESSPVVLQNRQGLS